MPDWIKDLGTFLLIGLIVALGVLGAIALVCFHVLLRVLLYGAPVWGTILLIWWLWYA